LRERLPVDLRGAAVAQDGSRFQLVYRTPTEWARELSNGTVHAVPFRHHIVYPALMRQIGRAWDARPR
jgi:hypothetical protein